MTDIGAKVSKSGEDVKTAVIADQIFNSEKNCIKISATGTVSSTLNASANYLHEISHGFSFAPGFLAWFEINNDGKWYFMYTTGSYINYVKCKPYSDSNKLYISLINGAGAQRTIKAYYAIFADEGA